MEDQFRDDLDRMYQLGYKHGYEVAKKDIEIAQLEREIDSMPLPPLEESK